MVEASAFCKEEKRNNKHVVCATSLMLCMPAQLCIMRNVVRIIPINDLRVRETIGICLQAFSKVDVLVKTRNLLLRFADFSLPVSKVIPSLSHQHFFARRWKKRKKKSLVGYIFKILVI